MMWTPSRAFKYIEINPRSGIATADRFCLMEFGAMTAGGVRALLISLMAACPMISSPYGAITSRPMVVMKPHEMIWLALLTS